MRKILKMGLDKSEELLLVLTILAKFFMLYSGNYTKSIPVIIYICCIIFLLIINFLVKYIKKVNLWKVGIVTGIVLFVYGFSQDLNILFIYLTGINFVQKGIRQYLKYFSIAIAIGLVLSVILCLVHIIDYNTPVAPKEGFYLYDLGLDHPNTPFMFYSALVFSVLFINDRIWMRGILLIIACVLFKYTYSRTGFFCTAIVLFLDIFRVINFRSKFVKTGLVFIVPLFLILSLYIANKLNTDYFNSLMSGRPSLWNTCIESYSWKMTFGNNIPKALIIDNFYIDVIYNWGLFITIIYFVLYTIFMFIAVNLKNTSVKVAMIGFFIYGLFEANIYCFTMNFPIAILFAGFISKNPRDVRLKDLDFGINKMEFLEERVQVLNIENS